MSTIGGTVASTAAGTVDGTAGGTAGGPRRRALLRDAGLALALAAIGTLGTAGVDDLRDTDVAVGPAAFALVLIAALVLAVRRIWPLATLAAVTAAASVYLVLGYPYGPVLLCVAVAGYTAARHRPLRAAAVAAGLALLPLLAHTLVGAGNRPGLGGAVPGSAWVVVPFALGVTARLTREAAARERADLLRRHADAERLRVAQEVHDVVAHGLAAITVQADVALHVLDRRPDQARTALAAISRTSREALDELRATLAGVRHREAGDGGADGTGGRAPAPGLARLDALLARMSDTGVPVRLETVGDRRDLPAAVDLAAYRVIQESLTNVLRHAGAASATVRLAYAPAAVTVEVLDTGRGGPARSPGDPGAGGHGLVGMRERVAALGGTFEAGPGPGGGFRVCANLPLEPTP